MKNRRIIPLFAMVYAASSAAQTCFPESYSTTPTSRFTDNGNGTVSDTQTGLMWKRCTEGMTWSVTTCIGDELTFTWQDALKQAVTVNETSYAGYTDWRVPNIKELLSIVDRRCAGPAINTTVFPAASSSYLWTSSPAKTTSYNSWIVSFDAGTLDANQPRSLKYAIRLVRTAQ
ncbi:Fimh-like protein [Gammaproteobacteria bacterium]